MPLISTIPQMNPLVRLTTDEGGHTQPPCGPIQVPDLVQDHVQDQIHHVLRCVKLSLCLYFTQELIVADFDQV